MKCFALECVKHHTYLGVILDQTMPFSPHIEYVVSRATKILNFIKQNLYKCLVSTKSTAYISLVHPMLEYATVWDPLLLKHIYSIDQVQRRAARWILHNYSCYSSVTSMQQELNWPTLQQCRQHMVLLGIIIYLPKCTNKYLRVQLLSKNQ